MGEVATYTPVSLPSAHQAETVAVISIIERASRDPAVDIDKMRQLLTMRKEMLAEEAERAFNVAMKCAQAEMRPIGADATNPQTRSKYATYAKLDYVLRPIYTKHGFSLSFDEADSHKPDHIRVVCYVAHEGGHTRTYRKDMPADGKGAKGGDVMTKTHAAGAAASYGARYLLKGIFNIAVGDEDRDGNEPTSAQTITEDQEMQLREMAESVGANLPRFLTYMKITRLTDLPADRFGQAMDELKRKAKK